MHYYYRLTFVSPSFTAYETGTFLEWDGDTKCVFVNVANTK